MTAETREDQNARHRAALAELTELTMALAREAAATALQAPESQAHILAFTRLATTARQLIALEAKLASPPKTKGRDDAAPPDHDPERARVGRIVRENAKRAIDGPRLRDINRYLETRLDQPDVADAINSIQPIGVIAMKICNELGIPFDLAKQPDEYIKQRPKPDP